MQHVLLQNNILAPCCGSGDEALSYLERNAVDLVLLDIEMPGRNGESTMREVVRRGWRVPVVAVTGHTDPQRHRQYRSSGFLDVAVKPIRVGKLGDQVRAWLSRFSSGPPPARQQAPLEVRVDADLAGLIPEFLEDRRNDVRVLSQRIAAGDWDAVRRIGHSMRGTGSAYGFDKVTEIGGRVEEIALTGAVEPLSQAVDELREYLDRVRIHFV